MKKFDILYKKLLENITTGSAFGAGQTHPFPAGKSGDFYAPGDARNIFGSSSKNKKRKNKSIKVVRRTFPGM